MNSYKRLNIWIDLTNSPHVLFFKPIISALEKMGHRVIVTARDYSHTVQMAEKSGVKSYLIGINQKKSLFFKAYGLVSRSLSLIGFAKDKRINLAISHGSNNQAIAAWVLGIPSVTIIDYEFNPAYHINFRLAKKVLVPVFLNNRDLYKYGASQKKIDKYDGLKEEIYLRDFEPDTNFLRNCGLPSNKVLVTLRPPNTTANYHRFENGFFDEIVDYLSQNNDVFCILLPRDENQKKIYRDKFYSENMSNLLIPDSVLDGPNLLYHSDLVISAGGTMNREAAVLGTPVYTVFKGKMGSIDKRLIKKNKMIDLISLGDVKHIEIKKKNQSQMKFGKNINLIEEIIQKSLTVLN